MTRQVHDGTYWTEEDSLKSLNVGFTQAYIDDVLGECFHILQADVQTVIKNSPMLVIETNDGLQSLKSPISGKVLYFNTKARNFPDRLLESEVILTIQPVSITVPKPKKVQAPKVELAEVHLPEELEIPEPIEQAQANFRHFEFSEAMIREINQARTRAQGRGRV